MKKLLLSAVLFLTCVAFAGPTATLNISGTVLAYNDIQVNANANATSLNITGGNAGLVVANAIETSNNLTGYTISMRSDNASKLIHSVDNTKMTDYTVSYDGGAYVTLMVADQVVKTVNSLPGLTSDLVNPIAVNVTAFAAAPAGTYSDLITVTIAANN